MPRFLKDSGFVVTVAPRKQGAARERRNPRLMIKMKRKKMNSQTKKRKKARKLVTRMKPTVNQTVIRMSLNKVSFTGLYFFRSI